MVTLALAKQHLEYEDTDRDELIGQYIAAAASWVENYTGKLLSVQAVEQISTGFSNFIQLNSAPIVSVDSLAYLDADDVEQSLVGYRVRNNRIYPPTTGWPSSSDLGLVTIGYQAGLAEVPADLISAQLLLIGHWFQNREAATERPAREIELAVEALCRPHRALLV